MQKEQDYLLDSMEDDYDDTNSSDTTSFPGKRAVLVEKTENSITKAFTETTNNTETTTIDLDYDIPTMKADLAMVSGNKDTELYENGTIYKIVENKKPLKTFNSDMLIYILILLLIIWLFCLFICLIWMFRCAQRKKNKIEEDRQKLLIPLLEAASSTSSSSNRAAPKPAGDESDEEWKSIKPAIYTKSGHSVSASQKQSNSEKETVKQPSSKAQFSEINLSEFEDKNGGDGGGRGHRGFISGRKAAPLRFD